MWRCARHKFNIIFPTVGDAAEIAFILKLPTVEVSIATQGRELQSTKWQ